MDDTQIDIDQCQIDAQAYTTQIISAYMDHVSGKQPEVFSQHLPQNGGRIFVQEEKRNAIQKTLVSGFFSFLTSDRIDGASVQLRHQVLKSVIQPIIESPHQAFNDGTHLVRHSYIHSNVYEAPDVIFKEAERVMELMMSLRPTVGSQPKRRSP